MKTALSSKKILSVILCILSLTVILSISTFAAKEMFMDITEAGVTDIDAPVTGQTGDYSATAVHSGKYEISKIEYYEAGTNILKGKETKFRGETEYYALITLKTKSAYFIKYNSSGVPNVSVTCNGNAATAVTVTSNSSSEFAIKYQFPKTENVITEVNITGVDKPVHGALGDTDFEDDNVLVTIGDIQWKKQSGTAMSEAFQYGEKYILSFYIFVGNSADFAKDYDHPLATADKPMPAVTVKVDGITATVMPDYGRNQFMRALKVAVVYSCDQKVIIDTVKLDQIVEPKAAGTVDYEPILSNGYSLSPVNDEFNKNGVAWRVKDGMWLPTTTLSFNANETYELSVRVMAENGYEFAVDESGNSKLIATVNGKNAEVKANRSEAIITYTFPTTGKISRSTVGIFGIDAPKVGETPDYDAIMTDDSSLLANYNNATTKNGITWYCETDKKAITTNAKFEADKVYTAQITFWAAEKYEYKYENGAVSVKGYVNGQEANDVTSRDNGEVTVYYTFPKTVEEKHICSPLKVDEIKATCNEAGKKSYYFCPECGKNFEDSQCTKEIADINAWGEIKKLEHKGGKATCINTAICEVCGEGYGEIAEHNWGTGWDYKDALYHAHTCKVCGIPDTPEAHSGGTAECGKLAKCKECKAEYGEVMQHQWSNGWEYSDSKGHAHKCTVCNEHDTVQEHSGGKADCQNKAKCSVCDAEYGKLGEHVWSTVWDHTTTSGHAHKCTVAGCDEHDKAVAHTPGAEATETSPQICTVCNFVINPAKNHKHTLTRVEKTDATCTEKGNIQHFICSGCDKLFEDSKGAQEITDANSIIIEASGHKESKWKSNDDIHWKECTVKDCNTVIEGTDLGHEFDEKGKCIVCKYRKEADVTAEEPVEPDSPKDDESNNDTEDTSDTNDDTEDTSDTNDATKDETQSTPEEKSSSNSTILIIIVAVLAVCCIGLVLALIKKNKK